MNTNIRKVILSVAAVVGLFVIASAADADITEEQVRHAWEEVCRIIEVEPLPLSIQDDDVPNAWVTAGKSVTVTTGLMKLMIREEEVFGVLSHEAGHAVLGHYEKRMNNAVGVGLLGLILGKAIDNDIADVAVGIGAGLAVAGFSREQEVQADDFAVDVAFMGGKDPTGIYTSLARLSLSGKRSQATGFSSHPPDDRRLYHVRERILATDPNIKIPSIEEIAAQQPKNTVAENTDK